MHNWNFFFFPIQKTIEIAEPEENMKIELLDESYIKTFKLTFIDISKEKAN